MQTPPSRFKNPFHHPEFLCALGLMALYLSVLGWNYYHYQSISIYTLIKLTPLLLILKISYLRHPYHLQWASMLILLYNLDGVTNLSVGIFTVQTQNFTSLYFNILVPFGITLFSTLYFILSLRFLRPLKKASKQRKKANSDHS